MVAEPSLGSTYQARRPRLWCSHVMLERKVAHHVLMQIWALPLVVGAWTSMIASCTALEVAGEVQTTVPVEPEDLAQIVNR